jgi:glutathione S-transferase
LLHIAEKDARLISREPQGRATALSWLFAAFNTIEPFFFELGNVDIFAKGEKWAELRRPSLIAFIEQRLDRLASALGDRDYLAGDFSVADIAMATVLREAGDTDLVARRPALAGYLSRCLERPAFARALEAQMAAFARNEPAEA